MSTGHQTFCPSFLPAPNFSWEIGRFFSRETYHLKKKRPRLPQWKVGWPFYAPSVKFTSWQGCSQSSWLAFRCFILNTGSKELQTSKESPTVNEPPKQEEKNGTRKEQKQCRMTSNFQQKINSYLKKLYPAKLSIKCEVRREMFSDMQGQKHWLDMYSFSRNLTETSPETNEVKAFYWDRRCREITHSAQGFSALFKKSNLSFLVLSPVLISLDHTFCNIWLNIIVSFRIQDSFYIVTMLK